MDMMQFTISWVGIISAVVGLLLLPEGINTYRDLYFGLFFMSVLVLCGLLLSVMNVVKHF